MFHTRRGLGHLGLALAFTGAAACSSQSNRAKPIDFTANGFDGFEDTRFDILSTPCSFPTTGALAGGMIINLADGETGYLFLRASDGYVVANGADANGNECKILASSLTGASGKKIAVYGTDGANNQKLIVDFYNGLWAQTSTATTAIATTDNSVVQVNFSHPASGTDSITGTGNEIKIRGTANADNFVFTTPTGQAGTEQKQWISYLSAATGTAPAPTTAVAARATNMADVSIKHADFVKVSTGPGNDIISPLGLGGTVTAAPAALSGKVSFYAWGGDGDDVIYSGTNSVSGVVNYLFGGAGNDKFIQSNYCSKDVIDGDGPNLVAGVDTVDYSAKTAKLKVTVGSANVTGVAAHGALTCVARTATQNNELFTLNDGTGTNTPTVFEFKSEFAASGTVTINTFGSAVQGDRFSLSNGTVTDTFIFDTGTLTTQSPPNYAIDIHTVTPTANSDIVDAIIATMPVAMTNSFTFTKGGTGNGTLTITAKTKGTAANQTVANTITGGWATVSNLTGGVSFTQASSGSTIVDLSTLSPTATAIEVCGAVKSAINAVGASLAITASGTTATLTLTNDTAGTAGNTVSDETVANTSFRLTDMYGGIDAYVAAQDDGDITCNSNAGEGDDILVSVENVIGGSADDIIDASAATGVAHILVGMAGSDTLVGADGNDTLYGGLGDDILKGGDGKDSLYGGDGSDTLQPGGGANGDLVYGGTVAQAENCPATATLAIATVGTACANVASSGVNTLDFSDRDPTVGVTCDLTQTCTAGTGGVLTTNSNICGTTSLSQAVAWSNIANLTGGAGDDILNGDNNANTIKGGSGNDIIKGMGGNDTIYGGAGDDTLYGSDDTTWNTSNKGQPLPASCTTLCTTDNDFISGGLGRDIIWAGVGNDFVDANDGDPDVIDCGGQDADIGVTDVSGDTKTNCAL